MAGIQIYVEGVADECFIKALIQKYLITDNISIEKLGGIDVDLKATFRKASPYIRSNEGKSVIIIDANGDIAKRKNDLKEIADKEGLSFEYFLLPNNSDSGNLETLLSQLISQKHQDVLKCFEEYQHCIKDKGYNAPDEKTKIYTFLRTVLDKKYKGPGEKDLAKEENRDYRNPDHWNLDHEYLRPLKEFLLTNCVA